MAPCLKTPPKANNVFGNDTTLIKPLKKVNRHIPNYVAVFL
jgi:hypothetical protein